MTPDADRYQDPETWRAYPVRQCRTMHTCRLCRRRIDDGGFYYDGGYGKRAHVGCVRDLVAAAVVAKERAKQKG